MRIPLILTAVLAIGGGAILAQAQSPRTINLARGANLAQAVASAPAGSTLRLAAGEFRLSAGLTVAKSLNLVGAGRDQTRIVSEAAGFVLKFAPQSAAGKLALNGITLEHRGNRVADVMQIEGGEVTVDNARFAGAIYSDEGEGGDGIYAIEETRSLVVRKSEFVRNQLNGLNHTAGRLTVQESTFANNQSHGLAVSGAVQATVERSAARGNRQSGFTIQSGTATLRGNTGEGNARHGIQVGEEATATLERNTARNNQGWGIFVEDGAQVRLNQNTAAGNREGQTRTEPPFNGNLKPGDDLEQAVRRAPAGATISLAAGTYEIESALEIERPLSIVGAGRDQTRVVSAEGVLSFESEGKLVIRGVSLEAGGEDPETDLVALSKGEFELSDCRVRGLGGQSNSESGDGVYINGAKGSIQNCEIAENSRHGIYLSGGQLSISASSITASGRVGLLAEGNLTARDVQLSNNQEDGLVASGELQIDLSGLSLKGNAGLGMRLSGELRGSVQGSSLEDNLLGGLQVEGLVQASLENNTVQNNLGTGVILRGGSRPQLRGNTIRGNALHGVALLGSGRARLEGNTIAGNQGYGILRVSASQAVLGTNTLQDNRLGDSFQR